MTEPTKPSALTRDDWRALSGAELGHEILAIIEDNLGRWRQRAWRIELDGQPLELYFDDPLNPACTTALCLGGWIVAMDGVKWAAGYSNDDVGDPDLCKCRGSYCTASHHQISVQTYAARRLELGYVDADALFSGDNSLEMLRAGIQAMELGHDVEAAVEGWDDNDDE